MYKKTMLIVLSIVLVFSSNVFAASENKKIPRIHKRTNT